MRLSWDYGKIYLQILHNTVLFYKKTDEKDERITQRSAEKTGTQRRFL